jgi:hypothetical protein
MKQKHLKLRFVSDDIVVKENKYDYYKVTDLKI